MIVPSILLLGLAIGATNIHATVATGSSPVAELYDAACGYVWIADAGGSVTAAGSGATHINAANVALSTTFGTSVRALTTDTAGYVYLSDPATETIFVYSCAGLAQVALTTPCPANALAWDPVSGQVWGTCPSTGIAFWLAGGGAAATFGGVLPITSGTNAIGFDPGVVGGEMIVLSASSNTATGINGVTHTIAWIRAVGSDPVAMAYDSNNGYMYVANAASGTVSALNATGILVATINVGSVPVALAYNPSTHHVFVANSAAGTVTDISGTTVVATIAVGTGPDAVAFDGLTSNMYVTDSASAAVTAISAVGDYVLATIPVGNGPDGIIYDPGPAAFSMYVIETAANQAQLLTPTLATPALAGNSVPWAIAFYAGGNNQMYASLAGTNSVEALNPTDTLAGTVNVGTAVGCAGPEAIAYSPASTDMYEACAGGNRLAFEGNPVTTVGSVGGLTSTPTALAFDTGSASVFVGFAGASAVQVVNSANAIVATVPINAPTTPTGMVYDPAVGSMDEFVAEPLANDVQLISTANAIVKTVPVGTNPTAVALDPSTNDVWVVCTGSNNVFVLSSAGTVLSTPGVGAGAKPIFIAYDPSSLSMIVSDPGTPGLSAISTSTYGVTAIGMPATTTPGPLAYDPTDGNVYVVDNSTGNLFLLSATNALTGPVAIGPATFQADIEYSPANGNMYYVNAVGNAVWDI